MVVVIGRFKIHKKRDKKRGLEWEQGVIYLTKESLEKIRELDGKVLKLSIGEENTANKELLNLLVSLFIKAFQNSKIAKELKKFEETYKILNLLRGA